MSTMAAATAASEPLLRVSDLRKSFLRPGLWKQQAIVALDGVSLELAAGKTSALVGESGSGKTTLALCIAQFETPDAGEIWLEGMRINAVSREERRAKRLRAQLVFQGSALALNPRFTALEATREPLDIQRTGTLERRCGAALACMRLARLDPSLASQRVATLSGGEKQRLAIARALTLEPALLIFDESFSGLDLIVQAKILDELRALQQSKGLTYLFITHDLSLAAAIADDIAVMQGGRIVEAGAASAIFSRPQHTHTRALLDAMPRWSASKTVEGSA
jgi:ABC-type glutathione transport system ATPase component